MSGKKIILTFIFCFFFSLNSYNALVNGSINSEWEKYINLTDEEKVRYEAIPEEYIYEYNPSNINVFKNARSFSYDVIPSKFNLSNVDGKIYVNTTKKHQGLLGLCWTFASLGSMESNIFVNGVVGIDDMISKCDSSNNNSLYCNYKSDVELNQKYMNGEEEVNATFSERNVDYILSKPIDAGEYSNPNIRHDVVTEGYNPYTSRKLIGDGGTFTAMGRLFSYGVSPKRALGKWEEYTSTTEDRSLYDIFDSVGTDYIVTDYYNYFAKPNDSTAIASWSDNLKKLIMQYGSTYIATISPDTDSGYCYHYNKNDNTALINYDRKCGKSNIGGHALQIVGWDDNYKYGYCNLGSSSSGDYDEEYCNSSGYTWMSGEGAWILKNSWGSYLTYVYLSYDSYISSVSGVKSVRVRDFDNSYNEKISNIEKISNTSNGVIYRYYKSDDTEYLAHVNIIFNGYNSDYKIYISNDGNNYTKLGEGNVDYSGMITVDSNNYVLDGNSFYVKIESSINMPYIPTVFTRNTKEYSPLDENVSINTYLDRGYFNKNNTDSINIRTKTTNVSSGSVLEYKIFDSNNNDVTDKFNITSDYVVTSNNIASANINSTIENGEYTLKTIYNDIVDEDKFYIIDKDIIKLKARDDIFAGDREYTIGYEILDNIDTSNYRWSSSDSSVADITDGVLNIKKSGKITVTLTVLTTYGDVFSSIDIVIYDDTISTPDEFISIMSDSNKTKNYYIVNDLDFTGVNYDKLYGTYQRYDGILNGGFHTISGVVRNNNNSNGTGLIAMLAGTVKNLIITDSVFTNTNGSAGSVCASLINNGEISNVYVTNTVVKATEYAGGIVGEVSNFTSISNSYFDGEIEVSTDTGNVMAGGIAGYTMFGTIENSYNMGSIKIDASTSGRVYASGIVNGSTTTSSIINSYSVGEINVNSTNTSSDTRVCGLSCYDKTTISDSYYLDNNKYSNEDGNIRTKDELLDRNNYNNWDFDNVWYMDNTYPVLRVFPTEITDINLDLDFDSLSVDSEYIFSYNISPYGNIDDVEIENLTSDLVTIDGNKLITNSNTGTIKLKLKLRDYVFTKEIEVKNIMDVNYDKKYTNSDLLITFNMNYYRNLLGDGYLEFIFNGKNKKLYNYEEVISDLVEENGIYEYTLNYCNSKCINILSSSISIDNIDKERPSIVYNYNKDSHTLNIELSDNISGLDSTNTYYYGISNSGDNMLFTKEFVNGKDIIDNDISYKMKYLWIKNVYDNASNGLCDSTYCVYELDIEKNKYHAYYYDEDKTTLIMTKEYDEDDIVGMEEYKKEDDKYYYNLNKWDGWYDGFVITKDVKFYAVYDKISKKVYSDKYVIDDEYIKNINLDDIYGNYSYKKFTSNLKYYDGFDLYSGSDIISGDAYLKTGMIYKGKYKSYKIILTGDVNGDGYVKMNDVMRIANYLVNNSGLSNEYKVAADINLDNNIRMNDLMRLANVMVNGGGL